MKLGIFGGTFNPIHNSHIYLAEEYHQHLSLDKVLLMPTNVPPHKQTPELASAQDRLEMCRVAVKSNPSLEVSTYEIDKGGVSYTYQTLEYLTEKYNDATLYLLMGADMFLSFLNWRNPQRIMELAVLCTAPREYEEMQALSEQAQRLTKAGARCEVLNIMPRPMSSSFIRKEIQTGHDVSVHLPTGVYEYIKTHGLYKEEP